jgi:hypothetical protein
MLKVPCLLLQQDVMDRLPHRVNVLATFVCLCINLFTSYDFRVKFQKLVALSLRYQDTRFLTRTPRSSYAGRLELRYCYIVLRLSRKHCMLQNFNSLVKMIRFMHKLTLDIFEFEDDES